MTEDRPRTALLYARVSKSAAGSLSTADQLAESRRWAEANGLTVVLEVVDEGKSASRYASGRRDGWTEVMAAVTEREVDVLVTWEASRSTRDLRAYAALRDACEESGVLWAYSGRVHDLSRSDDRFSTGLDALLSERESDVTRDRIQRQKRAAAERGRPAGRLPYGYRREYEVRPNGDRVLLAQVPDPEQAAVLVEATDRLLAGDSLRRICLDLDARGVPAPITARPSTPVDRRTTRWTGPALRARLLNPTIAGLRVHQGRIVGAADWPAVVPEDRWRAVRALLSDTSRRSVEPRGSQPRHLLTNVAVCSECGKPLQFKANNKRCPSYTCESEGCRKVSASESGVDAVVVSQLLAWLSKPRTLQRLSALASTTGRSTTAYAATADRLRVLRGQLDDAVEAFAAGDLSAALLARVEAKVTPEVERLESQRAALPVSSPELARLLSAGDVATAWESAPLVDQRAILRAVARVVIHPAVKRGRGFDPSRVEVRLGSAAKRGAAA